MSGKLCQPSRSPGVAVRARPVYNPIKASFDSVGAVLHDGWKMTLAEIHTVERDAERVGAALGRIPSGCSILTVGHEGRSTGLLVSWVQQAAFEPPSVTVCIKQGRYVAEWIDGSGRFLLNVVGSDPNKLFKHFGKGFKPEEDAFAGLKTENTPYGPLLNECIAHLGCEVAQRITVGDHYVYAATVAAARGNSAAEPYVHTRKTGLTY